MRTILALAAIAAGPAFAACPPPKDHSADLDVLIRQIQTVPDEATAQVVSQAMWRLWATAPDALAQDMLDQGMVMRAQYAFDEAIILFTDLIDVGVKVDVAADKSDELIEALVDRVKFGRVADMPFPVKRGGIAR